MRLIRSHGALCARVLRLFPSPTPIRGVAERREAHTGLHSETRQQNATSRLRVGGRHSALHRGDFRPYASSAAGAAAASASRRARGRMVKSGRVPHLPRRGSRRSCRDATPRSAFRVSGDALNERGFYISFA